MTTKHNKAFNVMGYGHERVNHINLEYARGSINTTTIEGGVWNHLKLSLEPSIWELAKTLTKVL